jgi:hypothetical protein
MDGSRPTTRGERSHAAGHEELGRNLVALEIGDRAQWVPANRQLDAREPSLGAQIAPILA